MSTPRQVVMSHCVQVWQTLTSTRTSSSPICGTATSTISARPGATSWSALILVAIAPLLRAARDPGEPLPDELAEARVRQRPFVVAERVVVDAALAERLDVEQRVALGRGEHAQVGRQRPVAEFAQLGVRSPLRDALGELREAVDVAAELVQLVLDLERRDAGRDRMRRVVDVDPEELVRVVADEPASDHRQVRRAVPEG